MNNNLIFVYGTLRKGLNRFTVLEDSEFVGYYLTKPIYTMVSLTAFPGLLEDGEDAIKGEVYRVSDDVIYKTLDRIEGHPSFYERKPIELEEDIGFVEAYFLPREEYGKMPVVVSGDWLAK